MRFSRFDIILVVDLLVSIGLIALAAWLRVEGHGDLPAGLWTFAGLVFGGEILSFSLYQMVKEVNGAKASKAILAKHAALREIEEESDGRAQ